MAAVVDKKTADSGSAPGVATEPATALDKVSFSVVSRNSPATATGESGSLQEVTFKGTDASERARRYLVDLVHPAKTDAAEDSATVARRAGGRARIIPTETTDSAGPIRVRASDPAVKELIRDLPKWQEAKSPEQKVFVRERVELGTEGADPSLPKTERIAQQLKHIQTQLERGRSVRVDVAMVSDAQETKGKLAELIKQFKDSKLLRVHAHGSAEEKEQIAQALGEKLHTKEGLLRLKVERFAAEVRAEQEQNAPLNRLRRWGARQLERLSSLWSDKKETPAAVAGDRQESDRSRAPQSGTSREGTSVSPAKQAKYLEQLKGIRQNIEAKWASFAGAVLVDGDIAQPPLRQVLTVPSVRVLHATLKELASMRKDFPAHQLQINVSPEVEKHISGLADGPRKAIQKALGLQGVDQRKRAEA